MRAVVVYESMYGNTHLIADAIALGLAEHAADVVVLPLDKTDRQVLEDADLVVVGGPTHAHAMSRAATRKAAAEAAQKPGSELELEADAEGPGLRDWFDTIDALPPNAAAFDTRVDAPAAFTGRASKGIAKRLRRHGCELVVEPESFLVTKQTHLVDDEMAHARNWGSQLATRCATQLPLR
jgi:Flavodoxin domain